MNLVGFFRIDEQCHPLTVSEDDLKALSVWVDSQAQLPDQRLQPRRDLRTQLVNVPASAGPHALDQFRDVVGTPVVRQRRLIENRDLVPNLLLAASLLRANSCSPFLILSGQEFAVELRHFHAGLERAAQLFLQEA